MKPSRPGRPCVTCRGRAPLCSGFGVSEASSLEHALPHGSEVAGSDPAAGAPRARPGLDEREPAASASSRRGPRSPPSLSPLPSARRCAPSRVCQTRAAAAQRGATAARLAAKPAGLSGPLPASVCLSAASHGRPRRAPRRPVSAVTSMPCAQSSPRLPAEKPSRCSVPALTIKDPPVHRGVFWGGFSEPPCSVRAVGHDTPSTLSRSPCPRLSAPCIFWVFLLRSLRVNPILISAATASGLASL